MKKFLLFMLCPLVIFGQVQIGEDIDGENAGDNAGVSVSLSYDGTIMAVGSFRNDGNGNDSGHIRVYKNESGSWTQIGKAISGEAVGDESGFSISLSSDGSILAIGARYNDGNGENSGHARVYKNESGNWTQIGNDINGEVVRDESGYSISLSSDGSILAIGAPIYQGRNNNPGYVRIFKNFSGNWIELGNIYGEASGDKSGVSVSLSSDGTIVAIGAVQNDGNGGTSGHVRVFKNTSNNWVQIGSDIDGEAMGDFSGSSVSLSFDGTIVAIGAERNDGNGEDSGHVRIYRNENGIWTQMGQDINGEAAEDKSGIRISLSADGSIVAIGAISNYGNGQHAGHVRVFKNISSSWVQIGSDIDGEAIDDFSGSSVSLSGDGNTVAIGAILNDGNGESSGHVRVYDLTAVLSTQSFKQDYFTYYPNPVKNILNLNLNQDLDLKQVNIYNLQSQYLYSVKTSKIDVSQLSSGMYFVEVVTNKGKSAKKIIIE